MFHVIFMLYFLTEIFFAEHLTGESLNQFFGDVAALFAAY